VVYGADHRAGQLGETAPPAAIPHNREADPKGWSTLLITALGSWEKPVPRGHWRLSCFSVCMYVRLVFMYVYMYVSCMHSCMCPDVHDCVCLPHVCMHVCVLMCTIVYVRCIGAAAMRGLTDGGLPLEHPPSNRQGFGRVNLRASLYLAPAGPRSSTVSKIINQSS
jgi:hypothetical protein